MINLRVKELNNFLKQKDKMLKKMGKSENLKIKTKNMCSKPLKKKNKQKELKKSTRLLSSL